MSSFCSNVVKNHQRKSKRHVVAKAYVDLVVRSIKDQRHRHRPTVRRTPRGGIRWNFGSKKRKRGNDPMLTFILSGPKETCFSCPNGQQKVTRTHTCGDLYSLYGRPMRVSCPKLVVWYTAQALHSKLPSYDSWASVNLVCTRLIVIAHAVLRPQSEIALNKLEPKTCTQGTTFKCMH